MSVETIEDPIEDASRALVCALLRRPKMDYML